MLWFRTKRTIKLGAKSLWMHRLRSILTALGIIFGVCSVIAMLAIGEGASREAQEQIARLGSTNLIIKTVKPPQEQKLAGQEETLLEYGLTYADAERFYNSVPNVEVVVPVRRISQQGRYRNRMAAVEVVGTVPWYPQIAPIRLIRGRYLSSVDLHHRLGVCVIDEQVANELFILDDPIGKDIRVAGEYYRVIGTVSTAGPIIINRDLRSEPPTSDGRSGGVVGNIYIPLTTVKSRFGELVFQFAAGARSVERVELQEITVKVQSMEQVLPTRDILDQMLKSHHEKKDYQITVPLELLRQAARTKRIFSIVLGSIAAISLLVGGIGIMNIMLASVSERTREIGIRRALGARRRDIIIQFLSETVMLALAGGVFGIILGMIIPYFVSRFSDMPTVITTSSLILAFGISAVVGVTFGLYPAYRAANMDPIESLRHE